MSNHKAHPLGGKLVSWPVLVLAPFAVLCGMLILKRLFFGLGSVTDRSHGAVLERERFDDQLIRAQTGLGAAQAVNH